MISCRGWWPRTKPGYITMTRRQSKQSMEWRHSGSTRPKKFRVKNSTGKDLASIFFGIKKASSSLTIFQQPKYQRGLLLISAGAIERYFEGKTPAAGRSPRGSCSWTTMFQLTGHLQPRKNRPTWASRVLNTHPILRIWPRRTTTCSLKWNNNSMVTIFRPFRRSLLPRRPGWTDKLLIYFECLAKVRAME